MVALLLGTAALPSFARKKKTKEVKTAVETPQLPANDRKRFDYFFLEAIRQQNAGNLSAAFELLEHARRINPQAAEVYFYESM